MKILLLISLFLFNFSYSSESLSGHCHADREMSFEITQTTLKLRSQHIDFEIPLEEGFFELFLTKNNQNENYESVVMKTEDSQYRYEISLMEPDRIQNKSIRITIETLTKVVSKTLYNKFIGRWVGIEKLPTEKYEFFIAYRTTGRPSQMLMRVLNISKDKSELEKILEQNCLIDTATDEVRLFEN